MFSESTGKSLPAAMGTFGALSSGGLGMGRKFLIELGGKEGLKSFGPSLKRLFSKGIRPHWTILRHGIGRGVLGAGGGLLTGTLLAKGIREGIIKNPLKLKKAANMHTEPKYLFWEKVGESSSFGDDANRTVPVSEEVEQDPVEEEKRKLELESQEQELRHKEEAHAQELRHNEEMHALKLQEKGMSAGGQNSAGLPTQPVDPQQAQQAAETNTLARYLQAKIGSVESLKVVASQLLNNPIASD